MLEFPHVTRLCQYLDTCPDLVCGNGGIQVYVADALHISPYAKLGCVEMAMTHSTAELEHGRLLTV